MSEDGSPYRSPYTLAPGSSTTSPEVGPKEGVRDLWGFFWLSLLNTTVIVVVGMSAWLYVHGFL